MGLLIDGKWTRNDPGQFATTNTENFTDQVKADGSTEFAPEPNRYTLYVGTGCPYAARPYSLLHLLGMSEVIDVIRSFPGNGEDSWFFSPVSSYEKFLVGQQKDNPDLKYDANEPHGFTHLHQLYTHSNPSITARVSVPVLFDKKLDKIVNNESLQIARMFIEEFSGLHKIPSDVPLELQNSKEATYLQDWIHKAINVGVYKVNFATTQKDFEMRSQEVYTALNEMEARLENQPFLLGSAVHLTDLMLFATLIRFDAAYAPNFGLTKYTIYGDYPSLTKFVQRVYNLPGIPNVVDIEGIKTTYAYSTVLHSKRGRTVAPTPAGVAKLFARAKNLVRP